MLHFGSLASQIHKYSRHALTTLKVSTTSIKKKANKYIKIPNCNLIFLKVLNFIESCRSLTCLFVSCYVQSELYLFVPVLLRMCSTSLPTTSKLKLFIQVKYGRKCPVTKGRHF